MLHNVSDVFLHGAKLVNYLKKDSLADIGFGLFVITFFITRLLYYPLLIFNSLVPEAMYMTGLAPWPNGVAREHVSSKAKST